jgi:hypothetical protein
MKRVFRYGSVLVLALALMLGAFGAMLTNAEAYDVNDASFGYGQHYHDNNAISFSRADTGASTTSLGYPANVPWQDSHYRLSGSYNGTVAFNQILMMGRVSEMLTPGPAQAPTWLWSNVGISLRIATAESYTVWINETASPGTWAYDGKGYWEAVFTFDASWMEWNRTMSTYRDGYVTFEYHMYITAVDMAMQRYYIAMDSTADELGQQNSISYFGLLLDDKIKFSYQNDIFGQENQSTDVAFTATSSVVTCNYLGSLCVDTGDAYNRTRVLMSLRTENDTASYTIMLGERFGANPVGGNYTNWVYHGVVSILFPISGSDLNATVQQQYRTANGTWVTLTYLNLTWGRYVPDLTYISTFDLVSSALGLTGAVGLLFTFMIGAVIFRRGTSMEAIGVVLIFGIISGTLVYVFLLGGT